MKKQYVINILNIILIVVLLLGFSFAWITDEQVKYGRWAELNYGQDQLYVMANNLNISLHVKVAEGAVNDDDNYEDFSDTDKPIFTTERFAPGDYLQYRLDITTSSNINTTIRVVFAGITTDSNELAEKLIFGTTRFAGYWLGETQPSHVVSTIKDKLNGNTFMFFEKLELPATTTSRKFSIYWYIFFDRTATNESATKYFNIPYLYVISI